LISNLSNIDPSLDGKISSSMKRFNKLIRTATKTLLSYTALYLVLVKFLPVVNTPYKNAPKKLIALIHALICTHKSLKILLSDWSNKNLVVSTHPNCLKLLSFEAGYLLFDLFLDIITKINPSIMIHHIIFIVLAFIRVKVERGDYFIATGLLMNASTPLLQLSWYLHKIGIANPFSKFVDALLVGVFVVCRFFGFIRAFYLHGKRTGKGVWGAFGEIPVQCRVGTIGIFAMNSIWAVGLSKRLFSIK
jgi:hypothetical protein